MKKFWKKIKWWFTQGKDCYNCCLWCPYFEQCEEVETWKEGK